jgi:hypothetical protein
MSIHGKAFPFLKSRNIEFYLLQLATPPGAKLVFDCLDVDLNPECGLRPVLQNGHEDLVFPFSLASFLRRFTDTVLHPLHCFS